MSQLCLSLTKHSIRGYHMQIGLAYVSSLDDQEIWLISIDLKGNAFTTALATSASKPQINNIKFQPLCLEYVSWAQGIGINLAFRVWMEETALRAVED